MVPRRIPKVLSIAGSDSGGGAGIQADLKAFARCGVHGMTAITAITAQNTVGVEAVEAVSPEMIVVQVRAVAEDIGVDAVKVGMLGTAETVRAVVEALRYVSDAPVVVDPVMVAESGAVLLDDEAREALVDRLLPLATVVTPNIPEARALTGAARDRTQDELARAVEELGSEAAVVTGGHSQEMVDVFCSGGETTAIHGERHPDGAAHGSGCTHSASLAAFLALGRDPFQAAERAREVTSEAVRAGLRGVGRGPGPVDVFDLSSGYPTP
jgi:hydroxymethylpyrimidine/phosphomethylpyrimidine kinase